MNYQPLGKYYYTNRASYAAELRNRKHSPAAMSLDIQIHGDAAFYLATPELLALQDNIYRSYLQFVSAFASLPQVAQDCYCRKCLIDEVVMTNDLEGVHSTRRDVLNVLQTEKNTDHDDRFAGLIKKYLLLIDGTNIPLNTLQDIRNLYNDIVLPEIAPEDHPDGVYFRKEPVNILSATEKVKHHGIVGETEINEHMLQSLQILKDPSHAPLVQAAILHYLIGYIHPFYDGNGRLSRFVSSYLLSQVLHPIVAYRLSYAIKQNKRQYYDAFDFVNDRNSGGDLTPFILRFFDFIDQAISSLKEKVVDVSLQLQTYRDLLLSIDNRTHREFLYVFMQNDLFSPDPLTLSELSNISGKSLPTIRKIIAALIDNDYPICCSRIGHANAYHIDTEKLADMLADT